MGILRILINLKHFDSCRAVRRDAVHVLHLPLT